MDADNLDTRLSASTRDVSQEKLRHLIRQLLKELILYRSYPPFSLEPTDDGYDYIEFELVPEPAAEEFDLSVNGRQGMIRISRPMSESD